MVQHLLKSRKWKLRRQKENGWRSDYVLMKNRLSGCIFYSFLHNIQFGRFRENPKYYLGGEAEAYRTAKTTAGSNTAATSGTAEIMGCTEEYDESAGGSTISSRDPARAGSSTGRKAQATTATSSANKSEG